MTGIMLSGVPIRKGSVIHGGITMDQVLANRIGQETLQPSMVLAWQRAMTGFHKTNFSNAYRSLFPGRLANPRYPMRYIPRWLSTACSRTAADCVTRACWIG